MDGLASPTSFRSNNQTEILSIFSSTYVCEAFSTQIFWAQLMLSMKSFVLFSLAFKYDTELYDRNSWWEAWQRIAQTMCFPIVDEKRFIRLVYQTVKVFNDTEVAIMNRWIMIFSMHAYGLVSIFGNEFLLLIQQAYDFMCVDDYIVQITGQPVSNN